MFCINLLEVSFYFVSFKSCLNYINGFSGIVIIVSAIPYIHKFSVDKTVGSGDLLWDIPYGMIIAYTLFVFVFIYLCFPLSLGCVIPTLLAPLIASFIKRTVYWQARASTLAFYMIMGFTFPIFILETPNWQNRTAETILTYLTLLSAISQCWLSWRSRFSKYFKASKRGIFEGP
jgi:hypothetical protein